MKYGYFLSNLLLFGRVCKVLGMDVTPGRMIEASEAVQRVGIHNRLDFYYALRGLMVTRQRDLAVFDEAFILFWKEPSGDYIPLDRTLPGNRNREFEYSPPPDNTPDAEAKQTKSDESGFTVVQTFSQYDVMRYKNFANMTATELAEAKQMIARLPRSLGLRKTRRYRAGKGSQVDTRRTFRRNLRYGGHVLDLPTRTPKLKPRPLILICDISGSMERHTRILLHFVHILASTMYQVESFVFSTRLTRITHQTRHKSVDHALFEIGASVTDWGAGTKTGEALNAFNYRWSRRILGRGAVVILITDGWDTGEPDQLKEEIQRLQRSCHRLIWLNPLLGEPRYEPLTRGAQAILPHVDDFMPVRNLDNLSSLFKELQKMNWRRSQRLAHARYIVDDT